MYIDSSIFSKWLPTLEELFSRLRYADDEDVKSRDSRPLMSILMRIRNISRIKGHFLTRRMGAASFNWIIKAHNKPDEARALDVESRLEKTISNLIRHHDLTPGYGASLITIAWNKLTAFTPVVNKIYMPVDFEKLNENTVQLLFDNNGQLKRGAKINRFEDNRYLIDFDDELERGGILRSIAANEVLRREAVIDWSNLNKRLKGIVHGSVDLDALQKLALSDKQIQEQLTALDSALSKAGEHNILRSLSAIDVQFKTLVDAAAEKSYADFIALLNNENAIAVLGQANTAELPSQGGSRAALQVLNLIRSDILLGDLLRIQGFINSQLIQFDFNLNYAKGDAPWEFEFKFDENSDSESSARTLDVISRFSTPLPLLKSEVYDKVGYTPPVQGDDILVLSQATANPFGVKQTPPPQAGAPGGGLPGTTKPVNKVVITTDNNPPADKGSPPSSLSPDGKPIISPPQAGD